MAPLQRSWISYGVTSFAPETSRKHASWIIRDSSGLAPQFAMIKRKKDIKQSPEFEPDTDDSIKPRRKNVIEDPPSSASKRPATPTLASNRPKRAARAPIRKIVDTESSSGSSCLSQRNTPVEHLSCDVDNTKSLCSPAPEFSKPACNIEFSSRPLSAFLDGLPYPSATQAAAANAQSYLSQSAIVHSTSSYNPQTPIRVHRRYSSVNHLTPHFWRASHQVMASGSGTPGQRVNHVPSPLGQPASSAGTSSVVSIPNGDYFGPPIMSQQMPAASHEFREYYEWNQALNQRLMNENAQAAEQEQRDFFRHGDQTFTLAECLLTCSLKLFCRSIDPGVGMSDDTVAEIIQRQREWNAVEGTNCEGLYVSLVRPGTQVRTHLEGVLRVDRAKWERIAWNAYWGWKGAMTEVITRLISIGELDPMSGQIAGSGFTGNVFEDANAVAFAASVNGNVYDQSTNGVTTEDFHQRAAEFVAQQGNFEDTRNHGMLNQPEASQLSPQAPLTTTTATTPPSQTSETQAGPSHSNAVTLLPSVDAAFEHDLYGFD